MIDDFLENPSHVGTEYSRRDTILQTVNLKTGEIELYGKIGDGAVYFSGAQVRQHKAFKELKEQRKRWKKADRDNGLNNFFFVSRDANLKKLKPENAARLIYLATFQEYYSDGGILKIGYKPMKINQLPKVLQISQTQIYTSFLPDVRDSHGFLRQDENGNLRLNITIFGKGKGAVNGLNKPYFLFYIKTIRELYEGAKRTEKATHRRLDRQLGYVFGLLPFVNLRFNVLCHNPFETDPEQVDLMSLKDFYRLCGVSEGKADRFKRRLKDFTITVNGKSEQLIAYLRFDDGGGTSFDCITVNPSVISCGIATTGEKQANMELLFTQLRKRQDCSPKTEKPKNS